MSVKLLRINEVAERLRISPVWLSRLVKTGNAPPHVVIGKRRVMFPEERLDGWIEANLVTSPPELAPETTG